MNRNISESIWLSDHDACSAQHLAEVSGLSNEELDELIQNGVIVPINDKVQPKAFQLRYVVTANIARRLRDDFELDLHGVTLALTLIRRIDELQDALNAALARHDHSVASHSSANNDLT